jgi:vancomycin resistance protein YoaR
LPVVSARASSRAARRPAQAPRRTATTIGNRSIGIAAGVAGVAALGLVVGLAFSGSPGSIAPGTSIDGVDVGGLSPHAAETLLRQRSARMSRVPVTFVAAGKRFSIRPEELSVSPRWSEAVEEAQAQGAGMDVLRGFRRLALRVAPANIKPNVSAYNAAVSYEIGRIAAKVDQSDRPARLVRHGLKLGVVAGRSGIQLDRTAAKALILTSLASLKRSGPVQLPMAVDEPSVSASDLATAQADARQALAGPVKVVVAKQRFTLTPRQLAPMLQLPTAKGGKLVLGGAAANTYFSNLNKAVGQPARGARFDASGDHVSVIPQQPGIGLDVPRSAAALLSAAESPTNRVARLSVTTVNVGRTTAEANAMGITGVVSSYETFYGGVPNRIHNVELVAHLLDGKFIAPGATFSFNQATGERTAAKGFLEAPVIINGELQTGLGGGVCQVSTTVFNAAYEAGLPITARTNHALYISHYPTGRDATVDYPDVDLKFVNDTDHWLLLRTFVGSSSLVVTLYGAPQHRRVVTDTAPLKLVSPPPVQRTLDPSLAPGTSIVQDPGEAAYSTSVERTVYAPDGKLLSQATWYSNYRSSPEIILVGPKPKPKPKAKEKPPATTTTVPAATGDRALQ